MAQEKTTANGAAENKVVENRSAADMLVELREKIERYKNLEAEISKLDQEQVTLENYVANMMASTVNRAYKKVNYYEEKAEESEESDFELSEEEKALPIPAKTKQTRASRSSKDSTPVPKASEKNHAPKHYAKNSNEGEDEDEDNDDHSVEKEDTVVLGSSQSDVADDKLDEDVVASSETEEPDSHTPVSKHPNGHAERANSRKRSRNNDDDDDEDDFDPQESSSGLESEQDEDERVFVDITSNKSKSKGKGKGKGKRVIDTKPVAKKAAPKKTNASANVKTAMEPPVKSQAQAAKNPTTVKRTIKSAEKPLPLSVKKPVKTAAAAISTKRTSTSLGPLLSSPQSAKTSRPSLQSPSLSRSSLSSTSLSLTSPNAAKRKSMVGTKAGTSLRDILSSSSAPRAGLRRGIKKTA
ncbi:hypothetical protein IW138_002626 [Coemansia sp. RSA 986]|nr:hypothetical protein IW138_002626 [Coemansia sp. RSA 986]